MPIPAEIASQHEAWQRFANHLADTARPITTQYFRSSVTTHIKADASPVTCADKETETAIRELIRQHYPEHGIYGEEWGIENPDAPLRWVIDPIDGTKAFIAGIPSFVTLIALCYEDTPILGLIDQPVSNERWLGMAGCATTYNNRTIACLNNSVEDLPLALLGTTDPFLFTEDKAQQYRRLHAACANQICGGDGYLYARLCSGSPQIICESGLKPHDFAALRPVIEGSGGIITDWQGNPLTLQSNGDILASNNAALHQAALSALRI
ncbi:MAG: inositol monophosphatase family protein [Alphaproteobacteria bacterium]|nr:inositol monophosphatase family protein [Alphaproteobacteria bacterium]